MFKMGDIGRRRCEYKQLITAETTTGVLESLLIPLDYTKVFG